MSFRSEDLEGMSLIDLVTLLQELKENLKNENAIVVEHAIDKRVKELKKESHFNSMGNIDYLM